MLLQTIGLEKTYTQGGVAYRALKGIDLEFEAEKFYAIIGKSGSGKSTLLHLLGSLDKPTGGKVILNGPMGAVGVTKLSTFTAGFVLVMIFQKRIVAGLTAGAVKG